MFWIQVISDDVTVHKREMEVLLAATASTQETAISRMMGIRDRYKSLVISVDSRLSLLEKSVEVHELYCDNYRQCREMIASAQQQLQQIQDEAWDDTATVQQQMDRLQVYIYIFIHT